MPVPTLFSITLPTLEILSDGKIHSSTEIVNYLSQCFNLTEAERSELVRGGSQTKLNNRASWARSELRNAGLLEYTGRGSYRITERGHRVLTDKPDKIDRTFLNQYEEYRKYIGANKAGAPSSDKKDPYTPDSENTPDEDLKEAYQKIRESLAADILDKVRECSPQFFEELVLDVLVSMGYGGSREEAQAVGRSGDGGIDGTINEDILGLDVIYIQAKRWENTVGSPEIQKFAGALQGRKAKKGVFITTSTFTQAARDFASGIENKIILIEGKQLANFMIDRGVGVTTEATYELKRIDTSYFDHE